MDYFLWIYSHILIAIIPDPFNLNLAFKLEKAYPKHYRDRTGE